MRCRQRSDPAADNCGKAGNAQRLGLRLGEGSGAALAVPLLRLACDLHGQMATFAEAAVADRPA